MAPFKILLVEDEASWQDILKDYLKVALKNTGYPDNPIQIVGNYDKARKALENDNFWNLLVVDISLSKEGDTFGKFLVKRAYELKIPTIVVSGKITVSDVRNFLKEYKVNDCFSKEDFASQDKAFIESVEEVLVLNNKQRQQNYGHSAVNQTQNETISGIKNGYALLIGIADYLYINPLNKTTIDAKDSHDTLAENGYHIENMRLLTDEEATKAAISNGLNWLTHSARVDDTVVIFFSGHGMQQAGGFNPGEYLCPVEANLNNLESSCISSEEFTKALRSIRSNRVVVFLDACHSGGVGEAKEVEFGVKRGLSETVFTRLAEEEGRVIIASCKADEVSWELPNMHNGLFTHYLLEGLRGGAARLDGTVPIMRLFDYVSDKVPQHRSQHPFIKSAAENFIVAVSSK
ncbi:MAG: caspase family protein [Cyanobacteria bacterium P01_A01_bin.45]